MSLRPSERTEVRRNWYKVAVDADDGRRRREDNMIEIRKSKWAESLQKKRREGMPYQNSILSLQSSVIEKKPETLPAMVAGVYTDDNNMQLEATTQFKKFLSIGGKRRSSFYYDIWNIKYLNKFKWDDLTTETANNNRTREQKLTMEISAAKRERDFYLKKVDQSKALKFMKERMNKKQKTRGGELSGESEHMEEAKVIRRFPQNRPVADHAVQSKPGLSKDILKEVFGSS